MTGRPVAGTAGGGAAAYFMLGKKTHGTTVTGKARVLDDAGSEHARRVVARRYGVVGRVTMLLSRLRGGPQRTVGIAIALTEH